jgi:membrane protease YdiL (CAAX protease family)
MLTADLILRYAFLGALGCLALGALWHSVFRKTDVAPGGDGVSSRLTPPPFPGTSPHVSTAFYQALDLLCLGFVFLLFFWMQSASAGSKNVPLETRFTVPNLSVSICIQLMMAGLVVFWMTRRVGVVEWLGLRWAKWRWVFLIGPLAVLVMWMLLGCLEVSGYMKWVEKTLGVDGDQETVKLLKTSKNIGALGLMSFAAVVVAPFCEETVFRGFLYPVAKRFAGPWVAAVFSGLVFAAAHDNVPALLPLFVLGAGLSVAYELTGSLWAPIFIHFCFNGATVAIQMCERVFHFSPNPGS